MVVIRLVRRFWRGHALIGGNPDADDTEDRNDDPGDDEVRHVPRPDEGEGLTAQPQSDRQHAECEQDRALRIGCHQNVVPCVQVMSPVRAEATAATRDGHDDGHDQCQRGKA